MFDWQEAFVLRDDVELRATQTEMVPASCKCSSSGGRGARLHRTSCTFFCPRVRARAHRAEPSLA